MCQSQEHGSDERNDWRLPDRLRRPAPNGTKAGSDCPDGQPSSRRRRGNLFLITDRCSVKQKWGGEMTDSNNAAEVQALLEGRSPHSEIAETKQEVPQR
jgi:hypothetical protein